MIKQNDLKKVSYIATIINLICLLTFNFFKCSVSGIPIGGFSLIEGAQWYALVYTLLIIPIVMLLIPVFKSYLGKNEKLFGLVLPIIGFILNIILVIYLNDKYKELLDFLTNYISYGVYESYYFNYDTYNTILKISGNAGFYLSQLCYVVSFVATYLGSKDIENENLNSFEKEDSNKTEEVVNETINDIKENNEANKATSEEVKEETVEETVDTTSDTTSSEETTEEA